MGYQPIVISGWRYYYQVEVDRPMGRPPWKSQEETEAKRRCNECRRWIDHTSKWGNYNHRQDCSRHPGDPREVELAKDKGLIPNEGNS